MNVCSMYRVGTMRKLTIELNKYNIDICAIHKKVWNKGMGMASEG